MSCRNKDNTVKNKPVIDQISSHGDLILFIAFIVSLLVGEFLLFLLPVTFFVVLESSREITRLLTKEFTLPTFEQLATCDLTQEEAVEECKKTIMGKQVLRDML